MKVLHELLNNKTIMNSYDGRSDGSIMFRLDDRTIVVIEKGFIMPDGDDDEEELLPIGHDD